MDWRSKDRFTDRAEVYASHRPSYPPALLKFLRDELSLQPGHVVADVGSGTGILSELLLTVGCAVHAVEPNREMREKAESRFAGNSTFADTFHSVDGNAEATGLTPNSVDLVIAAQAFHWFEPEATGEEFRRILHPGRWAVVCWNNRRTDLAGFDERYEELLDTLGETYHKIKNLWHDAPGKFGAMFPDGCKGPVKFPHAQRHDWEGLRGRLHSSSYAPTPGTVEFDRVEGQLRNLFDEFQQEGAVTLHYTADVYWGRF